MEMSALELLIPLTYIPGVALLIMSTSQRFINVNTAIHNFSDEKSRAQTDRMSQELRRAHLFRNSLLALYLSVVFFSLGSLVAFLVNAWGITTSTKVLEIATGLCFLHSRFGVDAGPGIYSFSRYNEAPRKRHTDMSDNSK